MFSFVEENWGDLCAFFAAAVQARKDSILHPEGDKLEDWIKDDKEVDRLRGLCPSLAQTSDIQTGMHAEVYIFERYVIKTNVFGPHYHDGQMSWLKWAKNNQTNPLVPKLAFLLVDEATDRFLAVMERLTPHAGFEHHSYREEIDKALQLSMKRVGRGPAFRKLRARIAREAQEAINELSIDIEMLAESGDDDIVVVMQEALDEHRITIEYIQQLNTFDDVLNRTHRQFFKPIRNKFRAAEATGHQIDVHAFNWMYRSNREPVLLDPIN